MKAILTGLLVWLGINEQLARAQSRIEGHLKFVHPLVTVQQEGMISIADSYIIGFPTGLSVRKNDHFAFDLELVPFVRGSRGVTNLLVHPGLLWGLPNRYTLATRAAFELSGVWGFTPSISRGFVLGTTRTYADVALPLRWGTDRSSSVTLAFHLGVNF